MLKNEVKSMDLHIKKIEKGKLSAYTIHIHPFSAVEKNSIG
jgi:hypothetical protein